MYRQEFLEAPNSAAKLVNVEAAEKRFCLAISCENLQARLLTPAATTSKGVEALWPYWLRA